ncbi:hypothetical protein DFH08DRAFT_960679 [Mycena albidolilacea]|uniref:Ribonuclease H1 N-terminal domain-containing protein n=1 Tax=Mycena albidolilacea TaxID=1033008 RepID=A0AAD7A0Z9_9AGAR|nr:hypothetical protein DFH08DRAFT_960679 [Mycena albidolilacea]
MRNDDRHPQRDVGSPDDTANDPEIARLLAEFNISESGLLTPPPTAPQHLSRIPRRLSSSAPPPYSVGDAPHLSEYPRNYSAIGPAPVTPTRSSTYSFRTPCTRGVTQDWSLAGYATQGVRGAHVVSHRSSPVSKKKKKSVAYVVFCGLKCGVFATWDEVEPLVTGVPNCIFRGFPSFATAQAAFEHAETRSWTRDLSRSHPAPIASLPEPISPIIASNALSITSETDNDRWYVVYQGIRPGVYRSQ